MPSETREVHTKRGVIKIRRCINRRQRFILVTKRMSLKDAIDWADNTREFKLLILEDSSIPAINHSRRYMIVRSSVDGRKTNIQIETLWKLVR